VSASPATDTCPHCGADVTIRARFCPECGTPLEEPANRTLRVELPAEETGPVPVSMQVSEPRWFGVTPPSFLLGLAGVLLVLAILLFAVGHWPYGLILLGLAALLLAAFMEAARRRPHVHETTARAGSDVRERARSSWETFRARSTAAAEVRRIQSGLLLLEAERKSALADLGAAAHNHDGTAESAARARLTELDEREAALRAQLDEQLTLAGERIRKARLPVQDTMMVLPSEPSPPPGEATPPQPAVVPEPYPPPDEATPPQPAKVPEPGPGGKPDED
jgi:zinc ribbon protein